MTNRKLNWSAADVRCPFFISEDRKMRSISCEGYQEGVCSVSRFQSLEKKNSHMGRLCAGRFQRCPVYKCTYESRYADELE